LREIGWLPAKRCLDRYRAEVRFRTPLLPALALASATLLAACGSSAAGPTTAGDPTTNVTTRASGGVESPGSGNAMVVNGKATANKDLNRRLKMYTDNITAFAQGLPFCTDPATGGPVAIQGDIATGASVDFARCLLNLKAQSDVIIDEASARKLDLVSGDWAGADDRAARFTGGPDSFAKLPKSEQDYYKSVLRAVEALGKDGVKDLPPAAPIEELCVRHILVATQPEADAIVKDLRAGGDFAAIAKEKSTDTGSGSQGGSLDNPDGSCDTPENISTKFVPEFAAATMAAKVGEVTDPVKSEFGFHIIEVTRRGTVDPASPAAVAAAAAAKDGAASEAFGTWFRGAMEKVEVSVDVRYGIWNDVKNQIEEKPDPNAVPTTVSELPVPLDGAPTP
jgi:PPIC-type PPIASE domain